MLFFWSIFMLILHLCYHQALKTSLKKMTERQSTHVYFWRNFAESDEWVLELLVTHHCSAIGYILWIFKYIMYSAFFPFNLQFILWMSHTHKNKPSFNTDTVLTLEHLCCFLSVWVGFLGRVCHRSLFHTSKLYSM